MPWFNPAVTPLLGGTGASFPHASSPFVLPASQCRHCSHRADCPTLPVSTCPGQLTRYSARRILVEWLQSEGAVLLPPDRWRAKGAGRSTVTAARAMVTLTSHSLRRFARDARELSHAMSAAVRSFHPFDGPQVVSSGGSGASSSTCQSPERQMPLGIAAAGGTAGGSEFGGHIPILARILYLSRSRYFDELCDRREPGISRSEEIGCWQR
jgi:hypothetical protein